MKAIIEADTDPCKRCYARGEICSHSHTNKLHSSRRSHDVKIKLQTNDDSMLIGILIIQYQPRVKLLAK